VITALESTTKERPAAVSLKKKETEVSAFLRDVAGDSVAESLTWGQYYSKSGLEKPPPESSGLGNTIPLNKVEFLNRFLSACNSHLKTGKFLVLKFEPKKVRSERIYKRFPKPFSHLFHAVDFLVHRMLPKLALTHRLYFWFFNHRYRVISLPECLARLTCAGFEIKSYRYIDNKVVLIAKKIKQPSFPEITRQGLIIKLPRVGKNGDEIGVYKIRTMHPYSEYLQEYVYNQNGTVDGDKFKDDFRVTPWGHIFRKYWLDEVPMLINYLRRELKLVGVRPLSKHKFNTYPESLQKERIKYKPGMIPPYYADLPETPEEFFETERKYLEEYKQRPFRTDLKYFRKSLSNILFKGVRSR
jgi:lipopolysaccharide/colanic/teichoic acid biosynthesis glycosyltransferase